MNGKETIVQLNQIFSVNVSEGTRVCPLVARLNPEWRCKEWEEERTEIKNFYGFNPEDGLKKDKSPSFYRFQLSEQGDEHFTQIAGQHN